MTKNIPIKEFIDNEFINIPVIDIKWSAVLLSEVIERKKRLEASVYDIEGKNAREVLKKCKWEIVNLWSENGLIKEIFNPKRFKREYRAKNDIDAVCFLGSSEMLEIKPKSKKYLSKAQAKRKNLYLKKQYILVSCSGTIGNVTMVSKSIENYAISQHVIRIEAKEYAGYIYAFLKTKIGNILVKTNSYGAVVQHIEPEHLQNIPIPNPSPIIKQEIHSLIMQSYDLRDESNELIDKAESLLIEELQLPPIEKFEKKAQYFNAFKHLKNFNAKLSKLEKRLDASYHVPIVNIILEHIKEYAEEVTTLGDTRISKDINLPGRFKRVYVEEGQGVVFFGGKQINELDPSNKKYLSSIKHNIRMENDLKLLENMILITRSGTIGKVNITPYHWKNWIINEHVIRIIPSNNEISGYIYCWLYSDYGYELLKRFTYGSVVDEIDDKQISKVQIPLLKNKEIQNRINRLILEANKKRHEAYLLEQKSIKILNEKVIYAEKKDL